MAEYTQHNREQLLAAALDITHNEYMDKLMDMSDEEFDKIPKDLADYATQYIVNFPNQDTYQVALQALASMCDSMLHDFVKLFGSDPLKEA